MPRSAAESHHDAGDHRTLRWASRSLAHHLAVFLTLLATISVLGSCDATPPSASSDVLTTAHAPEGFRSFSLASNRDQIEKIWGQWADQGAIQHARAIIAWDNRFIYLYTFFFFIAASAACILLYLQSFKAGGVRRDLATAVKHWALLTLAILLLAYFDARENAYLESCLANPRLCELASLRFFAQAKWIFAATAGLAILLTTLTAVRSWLYSRPADGAADEPTRKREQKRFEQLIQDEYTGVLPSFAASFEVCAGPSGEPKVKRCNRDFVGLAMSGGGIRSATFNLGVLQSLYRLDLLRHIDYLATVSGGGYLGGFWSRWLKERHSDPDPASIPEFPDSFKQASKDPTAKGGSEAEAVRHLREFGKFLIPRTGIFDTETWGAAVAVLAGLLPAILAALSVLGLTLIGWLALTFYLACPDVYGRVSFAVASTLAVFLVMETWWRSDPTGDITRERKNIILVRSFIALLLIGVLAGFSGGTWSVWSHSKAIGWQSTNFPPSYENWWAMLGIVPPIFDRGLIWIPQLYEPAIGWLAVALVFFAFRFRGAFTRPSMEHRVFSPTIDRTTMRVLGIAVAWAAVASLWHIGLNFYRWDRLAEIGTAAAGGAGLFALLRNWIGERLARAHGAGLREKIKPYLPQILAYLTVGLAWAAIAGFAIRMNQADWFAWYQTTVIMAGLILLTLLVDPHEYGLHAVYRDRICRTFLGGASQPGALASENRQTDFRRDNDVPIGTLLPRPLHLVCCAANNLGGDHLSTLSRGAKSAVLSRNGVAVGDHSCGVPRLTLGSALTASAAAANSNMGSVSMRLGPAVSFLMSALNLRLGLWVRNPTRTDLSDEERLLPGVLFFKEMASATTAHGREIHLSDGAHFDNLGLYELVRRHCRYIIVTDCTADPEVAFDDFGNTARRIREDFDIEIDIDLEPLRPGPIGTSREHAVVGTIYYGPFDTGVLLYTKPTLTGDEPVDVTQYKTRNPHFPHEGTADQFYDEAQWESYRRLGVHTINRVFEFLEHLMPSERDTVQKIFDQTRKAWYPTPKTLPERSLEMNRRLAQLDQQLLSTMTDSMRSEIFPELDRIGAAQSRSANPYAPPPPASNGRQPDQRRQDEIVNLGSIMRVITFMEEVVQTCDLQTQWDHPLNDGWVNWFARWASAPTFLRWWPFLKPMYSPALRNFLENRFLILRKEYDNPIKAAIREVDLRSPTQSGLAIRWWHQRHRNDLPPGAPPSLAGTRGFEYSLEIPEDGRGGSSRLQVALVGVEISGGKASWTSEHLFVPRSLWGTDLAVNFLTALLDKLKTDLGVTQCIVTVKAPNDVVTNKALWDERFKFVDFYRQAGFHLDEFQLCDFPGDGGQVYRTPCAVLVKTLT